MTENVNVKSEVSTAVPVPSVKQLTAEARSYLNLPGRRFRLIVSSVFLLLLTVAPVLTLECVRLNAALIQSANPVLYSVLHVAVPAAHLLLLLFLDIPMSVGIYRAIVIDMVKQDTDAETETEDLRGDWHTVCQALSAPLWVLSSRKAYRTSLYVSIVPTLRVFSIFFPIGILIYMCTFNMTVVPRFYFLIGIQFFIGIVSVLIFPFVFSASSWAYQNLCPDIPQYPITQYVIISKKFIRTRFILFLRVAGWLAVCALPVLVPLFITGIPFALTISACYGRAYYAQRLCTQA